MTFDKVMNPETAVEVIFALGLELLIIVGNYVINGLGPVSFAVITVLTVITMWILWAEWQIIKRDSLYPYARSKD